MRRPFDNTIRHYMTRPFLGSDFTDQNEPAWAFESSCQPDFRALVLMEPLMEQYSLAVYYYFSTQSYSCAVEEEGKLIGVLLAHKTVSNKVEHAHAVVLVVASEERHRGIGAAMLETLEIKSAEDQLPFVDLYVRVTNAVAIALYQKRGYEIYARVTGYYDDKEDAFNMRKPTLEKYVVPLESPVLPCELDVDYVDHVKLALQVSCSMLVGLPLGYASTFMFPPP